MELFLGILQLPKYVHPSKYFQINLKLLLEDYPWDQNPAKIDILGFAIISRGVSKFLILDLGNGKQMVWDD